MSVWKEVPDNMVRHIWKCINGKCADVAVPPTQYAESGTPVCGCGDDMEYVQTEFSISADASTALWEHVGWTPNTLEFKGFDKNQPLAVFRQKDITGEEHYALCGHMDVLIVTKALNYGVLEHQRHEETRRLDPAYQPQVPLSPAVITPPPLPPDATVQTTEPHKEDMRAARYCATMIHRIRRRLLCTLAPPCNGKMSDERRAQWNRFCLNLYKLLHEARCLADPVHAQYPPGNTCIQCPDVMGCEFAFDPYNTDGEALCQK